MTDQQPKPEAEQTMNAETIAWLLASPEPWVVYNSLLWLTEADGDSPEVRRAYQAVQADARIAVLLDALDPWPPAAPMKQAYNPADILWKIGMLADFGLQRDDPRIAALAERILAAQADDGAFLQGGFAHTHTWDRRAYICIAHVMTYALARFGYLDDPRLQKAYDQIQVWERLDGGWHPNQLNLPGGKRQDEPSCPFGTVNILRALAVHPGLRESQLAARAAGYLLDCWVRREEPYRPVGFGIGTTWNKLQYPYVQYQLLKVADTLARIPAARQDARFEEIKALIRAKRTPEGGWLAESINKPYKDFDFGQKKVPSTWITFLALRIING